MRGWLAGLLALLVLGVAAVRAEDEAEGEGEDGVQFEDNTVYKCVVESCSGWRLNKVLVLLFIESVMLPLKNLPIHYLNNLLFLRGGSGSVCS